MKKITTPSSSLVRTQAFQACSTGSNPVGVAKIKRPPLGRSFNFVISRMNSARALASGRPSKREEVVERTRNHEVVERTRNHSNPRDKQTFGPGTPSGNNLCSFHSIKCAVSCPVGVAKSKGPLSWRLIVFVISPVLAVAFFLLFPSLSFCEDDSSCTKCQLLKEPVWVQELVKQEEAQPPANPPARLDKCSYKGKTTYYLPPRCCDIESSLFNEEGKEICSPDGGETGHGDGRCPDFYFGQTPAECKTIWKDERE